MLKLASLKQLGLSGWRHLNDCLATRGYICCCRLPAFSSLNITIVWFIKRTELEIAPFHYLNNLIKIDW
jgi:hypothetical protein